MPKDILIHTIQRTGSNHLHFNLHVQDGFFGFSERVQYPNVEVHDVLGMRGPDVGQRLKNADFLVWKLPVKRRAASLIHKTIEENVGDKGAFYIMHVRHPYLTFQSWRNRFKKLSGSKSKVERPWDVSIDDIAERFIELLEFVECIDKLSTPNVTSMLTFHEDVINDSDRFMLSVLRRVGVKNVDDDTHPNSIHEYVWKNFAQPPIGYGDYNAFRDIALDDEYEKIDDIDVAEALVEKIYNDKRIQGSQSPAVKSVADQFYEFYSEFNGLIRSR